MTLRLPLTDRTSGITYTILDVASWPTAVGGYKFVAGATSGALIGSADGVTWSSLALPSGAQASSNFLAVICDGTYWYVGGTNTSGDAQVWRSSTPATSWTAVWSPAVDSSIYSMAYDASVGYVATTNRTDGTTATIGFSSDGASWTGKAGPTGLIPDGIAIKPGGTPRYVMAGGDGDTANPAYYLVYSDDAGNTWTPASSVPLASNIIRTRKMAYNGSYFITQIQDDANQRMDTSRTAWRIYTSTDGNTWSHETGFDEYSPVRSYRPFCFTWDSTRSRWLIGGNWLRVLEASGSQGSLTFSELPYKAGFGKANRTLDTINNDSQYVRGIAVSGTTVVGVAEGGAVFSGDWVDETFATSPSPAHQKWGQLKPTTVSNTTSLSWSGGTGTVYFGKNPDSLVSQGSQSSPWSPGTLDSNETYYWRVDIGAVQGDLWRFYTEPADTSEKLHTYAGTWNAWSGSFVTLSGATPVWVDRITFSASQLAGGHRHLITVAAMAVGSGVEMYDLQVYSEDANGVEGHHQNTGNFRVGPYYTVQNKLQTLLVPNPGESIKIRTRGHAGNTSHQGLWVTVIDLDSPGMVEGVDWGYELWGGAIRTNNSSTNDAFPLVDLEWTPDGESDYIVWAGAFWDTGGRYYNYPHGYRFRDRDTNQILARTGHIHAGDTGLDFRDGNASMHTFKKPPASLKRLRMDLWGYGSGGPSEQWRARDCMAVWFRVSKMRNYAIDSSWRKKAHYSGSGAGRFDDVIANYSGQGMAPVNSVPFRPDANGTAVFFCFLQGMGYFRAGGSVSEGHIGAIMSWGDFDRSAGFDKIWSTTRASPTKDQEFQTYDLHRISIGSSSWYTEQRLRDTIIGCRRKTGLANETRDLNLWFGNLRTAVYHYCHIHNVAAFGEQYCDAGAKPGIQQMVPRPGKRAVPHDEPITFKLSSENGVDVDLVRIKERFSPEKPVVMGGDAQTDGAYFYKVASSGAILVAASNKGKVYRSLDGGGTWTGITLPTITASTFLSSRNIIWNPNLGTSGRFVGCSDAGVIYYSTDATGSAWVEVNLDAVNRLNCYDIVQNSSGLMVVTDNYNDGVWWSTDAITWNLVNSTTILGQTGIQPTSIYAADCDGTNFVIVGRRSGGGFIGISTDGANWSLPTSYPATIGSSNYFYDIAYGNGTWVIAVYYSTAVITSTDRLTWTARDLGSPGMAPYRVMFGNGEFLLHGGGGLGEYHDRSRIRDGRFAASTDGVTWEKIGYLTDNEEKNGWLEGDYNGLIWDASWAGGSWWINGGRPSGAMLKFSGKLLGTTWQNIIVNDVFQSGWDGAGSGITATPGISGMVDVTIDPGTKLKHWTNYLIEVQASDSVSGTPMETYQWDFNTWGNRAQIFNMSWRTGYGAAPYSTYYDEIYAPAYDTNDPYYKFPEILLPTHMFTNGHRYLLLGSGHCYGNNGASARWKLHRDGVLNADSKLYHYCDTSDSVQAQFMRLFSDIKEGEIFEWFMDADNDGLSVSQAIHNTFLTAIDLDSGALIENTNWWYAEDISAVADVAAWTPFASKTFDAIAGEDYMVIACCQMANSNNYPNAAFRIYDVTEAAEVALAGHRPYTNLTSVTQCYITAGVITPASTGSHTVRVEMHGGSYFDHRFSSIFVLHLGLAFKRYDFVDTFLNQTGLPPWVYPNGSGAAAKANLTLPGDDFGEIFALSVIQGRSSATGRGFQGNLMLNDGRFSDIARAYPGDYQIQQQWAIGQISNGSYRGRACDIVPNIQYGHAGDNDLSLYVGAVNAADELERVALIAFGTEPGAPPDVPVNLSLDPINTASSLDDITPDVTTPIPEPDIPDYPREVFSDPSVPGVRLALLEPETQTTDQLQIANRSQFTLVTSPTLDDLGVPPGDTGGTVRLGLLPGDRIVLSGAGPNDGVTYTIKDGNNLEVLEEINDWSTDTATYDFVAYRRK